MSNVIQVNFTDTKENSGYIMNGHAVDGVYKSDIIAVRDQDSDDGCMLGLRGDSQVINPVELTIDELNEFCLMWLCIFNPEVIKDGV